MPGTDRSRGGFRSFVRGGQTTIHTIRMLTQVLQVVGGSYLLVLAIVVGTWIWLGTSEYDRYLTYKFYEADIFQMMGQPPEKELWVDLEDGRKVKAGIGTILTDPAIMGARDHVITTVFTAFIWGSILGGVVIVVVLWFFIGHGTNIIKDRHARGARVVSHGALRRMVRVHNLRIRSGLRLRNWIRKQGTSYRPYHIVGVAYPWRSETLHTMVAGTTGTGKTTVIRQLVSEIRKRGDRAVIFDKMGNFVEEFYDPKRDVLLNPIDARCRPWCVFSDAETPTDFDTLAEALIPSPKNAEPIWPEAARTIFSQGAQLLKGEGRATNEDLIGQLLKTDLAELAEFFKGTLGAPIISPKSARMSNSVRMMLNTFLRPFTLLPDEGEPFSITDWVENDDSDAFLFLTSRADIHSTLKPLISVWMDIAIKALLSRARDRDRTVWFILDEIASLHKLPSLQEGLKEGRQFGAAYVLGVQVQSQLRDIYGNDGAQSISGLCRTKVILAASDRETAEWYAGALGRHEIRRLEEGFSYGASVIRDGVSFSSRDKSELIVIPEEIMNLRNLTGYVKLTEGFPAARFEIPYRSYVSRSPRLIEREGAHRLATRIVGEAEDAELKPARPADTEEHGGAGVEMDAGAEEQTGSLPGLWDDDLSPGP